MELTEGLTRGWQRFKADKGIWILGILAALFGQTDFGSNSNFNFPQPNTVDSTGATPDLPPWFNSDQFQQFIENPWPLMIVVGLVAFGISLIFAVIGLWFKVALVHRTSLATSDQQPGIGASMSYARSRLLPAVLLGLVLALPLILAIIAMVIIFGALFAQIINMDTTSSDPSMILGTVFGMFACLIPLLLLVFVFGLVISLIEPFALRSCVLERLGVRASLRQSWRLLRSNLGISVFTWFVLGALIAIVGLVAMLPTLLAVGFMMNAIFNNAFDQIIPVILGLWVYTLVMRTLLGGLLSGYQASVWTTIYEQIHDQAAPAAVAPAI